MENSEIIQQSLMGPMKLKVKNHKLAYRNRHLSLTANDEAQALQCKQLIGILQARLSMGTNSNSYKAKLKKLQKLFMVKYISLMVVNGYNEPLEKMNRDTDSFSDSESRIKFRFLKEDLRRIMPLFQIPDKVSLPGKNTMRGEEVFLRGLYELVSGHNQHDISADVFGQDQPRQSKAFTYFINHVYDKFHHLLSDNLEWWHRNGYLRASAEAIGRKIGDPNNLVAAFIDCNCLPSNVTGGGPTEEGANAARWDPLINQAFYNGWKSIHGLKHQSVDIAYGFSIDLHGPASLRRNDLSLLRRSNVNDRFRDVQRPNNIDSDEFDRLLYMIFGDSAYKPRSHTRSYFPVSKMPHLTDEQRAAFKDWNRQMKSVRISIEWNYGVTATLFRYLRRTDKLKVLQSDSVMKVYTVATLFRNLHIGLYGGNTSTYFGLVAPHDFVEKYLTQTDFVN